MQTEQQGIDLISLSFKPGLSFTIQVSIWIVCTFAIAIFGLLAWRWYRGGIPWKDFEIDEAEIGVGTGRIKLKPNMTDRQVAYSIWVELSTRKIGLPIDFDHDVVAEVYDSWHAFFSVTRELIKFIPVTKVRGASTQKIVNLSIEVLNEGLRPHLTKWQARFRRWYEAELNRTSASSVIDPQEVQKKFPRWPELIEDMERVNKNLMKYREKMRQLVITD
jgi:hypothetical protein